MKLLFWSNNGAKQTIFAQVLSHMRLGECGGLACEESCEWKCDGISSIIK